MSDERPPQLAASFACPKLRRPHLLEGSMAISTCAKCEGHVFERGLITPLRELRAVAVLQCANCGAVVGTLETEAAIESLQKQIAAIDAGLVRIVEALQEQ